MRYIMLIYADEKVVTQEFSTPEGVQKHVGKWGVILREAGNMVKHGEPLAPTASATTVRIQGGKTLTTDGPFAETKEALAGYFLVDCKDLDEAIALASKMATTGGTIEVRPIAEEVAAAVQAAAGGRA